jgi:hypothetical protein
VINGLACDGTNEQLVDVKGAVAFTGQNFSVASTNGALCAPGESFDSGLIV